MTSEPTEREPARFSPDEIPLWWQICPNPDKPYHWGDMRWLPDAVTRRLPPSLPPPCIKCCDELLAILRANQPRD